MFKCAEQEQKQIHKRHFHRYNPAPQRGGTDTSVLAHTHITRLSLLSLPLYSSKTGVNKHSIKFCNHAYNAKDADRGCCCLLIAQCPSNMLVYLRDGSARVSICAPTLRLKLQIKLSTSPTMLLEWIYKKKIKKKKKKQPKKTNKPKTKPKQSKENNTKKGSTYHPKKKKKNPNITQHLSHPHPMPLPTLT